LLPEHLTNLGKRGEQGGFLTGLSRRRTRR
jgi:hypothetical protein